MSDPITLLDVFHQRLQHHPDRLIIGELRGPEARTVITRALTEPGGLLTTLYDPDRQRS